MNTTVRTLLGAATASLLLGALWSSEVRAATDAGRVTFTRGAVTAVNEAGASRKLVRGAKVFSGDTISTGASARAQVRFTDGSFMSLVPKTDFVIEDYQFGGEVETNKGFFKLLKGGLRALTGKIGKKFNKNYQLSTPVATIGIRGTWYRAVLDEIGRLLVSVGFDPDEPTALVLSNAAGELVLERGDSGVVESADTAPQRTSEQVVLDVTQPTRGEEPDFVSGDERDETGAQTVLEAAARGGNVLTGLIGAIADNATIPPFIGIEVDRFKDATVVFGSPPVGALGTELPSGDRGMVAADIDAMLASAAGDAATIAEIESFLAGADPADLAANRANPSQVADFFELGGLQVWRWTGGNLLFIEEIGGELFSEIDAHTGNQSEHNVALLPSNTPLPMDGSFATYTFIPGSGTQSTSQNTTIGPGITGGTLMVTFDPGTPDIFLELDVTHNHDFFVQGVVFIDPATQTFGNDVSPGGEVFATSPTAPGCSLSCNAEVAGVIDPGIAGLVGVVRNPENIPGPSDDFNFAGGFQNTSP